MDKLYNYDENFTPGICFNTDLTDLECVCAKFLEEMKDSSANNNLACVAISDKLLTYYGSGLRYNETIKLDSEHEVTLNIREGLIITDYSLFTPIIVNIDSENGVINFQICLELSFYRREDLFAQIRVLFSLDSIISMRSSYIDFSTILNKKLISADPLRNTNDEIINEVYGSRTAFEEYLRILLGDFTEIQAEGTERSKMLLSVINRIEVPEDWRYLEGVNLTFMDFYYRKVRLMGDESGCIFSLFTIESLDLPDECTCTGNFENDKKMQVISNSRKWIAIGLTKEAILEIAKPLVNTTIRNKFKGSINKIIEGEAHFWAIVTLDDVAIKEDGLEVIFSRPRAGGEASVKEKIAFGYKLSASVEIQLINVKVKFNNFRLNIDGDKMNIICEPDVSIGHIEVLFNPDPPELRWIKEIIRSYKDQFANRIKEELKFKPFNKPKLSYFIIDYAFARYDENKSMILVTEVRNTDAFRNFNNV